MLLFNQKKMQKKFIESLIQEYVTAVDAGDATTAEKFLHPTFRVVLPNYKGQDTILTREQYTSMMKDGKVGGNKRQLTVLLSDVHDNAALIKVKMEGEVNTFTNYYNLIKVKGSWMIVNDIPQIEVKAAN